MAGAAKEKIGSPFLIEYHNAEILVGGSKRNWSTSGSRGTDDSVSKKFEIFSVFMFSRSRNVFLTFLQSYHVRVISKIHLTSQTGIHPNMVALKKCQKWIL